MDSPPNVQEITVPEQLLVTAELHGSQELDQWPSSNLHNPCQRTVKAASEISSLDRSASMDTGQHGRRRSHRHSRCHSFPPPILEDSVNSSRVQGDNGLRSDPYIMFPSKSPNISPNAMSRVVGFPHGTLKDFDDKPGQTTSRKDLGQKLVPRAMRSSIYDLYDFAKSRGSAYQRTIRVQTVYEYSIYVFLSAFVYLVLIGLPLWKGSLQWLYWLVRNEFAMQGGWAIVLGLATIYTFLPLLILFERSPSTTDMAPEEATEEAHRVASDDGARGTAVIIPCYKSAKIIAPTLEAALKIFPSKNIFVIANGNSVTPLDETEAVCRSYRVHHIWSPVGSKIIAQFVGCYAAERFKYVLLIDDDCLLPPIFPVVSDRLTGRIKCIGYTIKSVGSMSSKGNWCQQAQDLEYKLSGLHRAFAGRMGSATFPHGAISLWDREFLKQTFHEHPGFSVSEDWFFGDSCRRLGGRVAMCTSVFVETETPPAVFYCSGAGRGGFGEMTVFKQRFLRWNFFFVNGMYYNIRYIFGCWKLGWWELGAKIFVWQEVYETLLYLLSPFILPISFLARPVFSGIMLGVTIGMYLLSTTIFNEIHLRKKRERVSLLVLFGYYTPYKIMLALVNIASCYWSVYKYARFFAIRHPKVIEDEKAIAVVLRLEDQSRESTTDGESTLGRTLTVTKVKTHRNIEPNTVTHIGADLENNYTFDSSTGDNHRHAADFEGKFVVQRNAEDSAPTDGRERLQTLSPACRFSFMSVEA